MLEIKWTNSFKKDMKKYKHELALLKELNYVLENLVKLKPLDERYRDHSLTGNWVDHRECHVKNDLLLIYRTEKNTLFLVRLGSHSELF